MASQQGTIGEIINEFCDRLNIPRQSSYVGSTVPASRQYLSLFKKVGKELLDQPSTWPQLKRTYTFTTTTNVSVYQLPGDYHTSLTGTQYGVTTQIPLAGPISNAQLSFMTYGVVAASPFSAFQINGANGYIYSTSVYTQYSAGYFQISPAGQNNTDQNVIAYQSCNYVWPINWVTATNYSVGNIRTGINNMYYCYDAITSSATRPSVTTGTEADGDGFWQVYTEPYAFSSDNDICLFDYDLMVEGLRWAWYEAKRQDFASVKQSWLSSVRSELGKLNGAQAINAGYNVNNTWDFPRSPIADWGPIPS